MTFIPIILVLLPLLVFIIFLLHDSHRGVSLVTEEDIELARYIDTHHRWIAFWLLVPGWLLAVLVAIDHLFYFYAWGFYSPIFQVEYDLPENGEITLYLSWVYLALGTLWIVHNFLCISRINHSLDKLKDEIK